MSLDQLGLGTLSMRMDRRWLETGEGTWTS